MTDFLEQQRAQAAAAQVDTHVHSAIYDGVRESTARYLHQNYPATDYKMLLIREYGLSVSTQEIGQKTETLALGCLT